MNRTLRSDALLFASALAMAGLGPAACGDDEEEELPPEQPELAKGEACDPNIEPIPPEELEGMDPEEIPAICAPGLACDPVADGGDFVCGTALVVRGRVTDSTTGEPIESALVAALNETGEPVTDVASTDACGDYVLPISVRRTADGEFAETPKWTLNVSAQDYLPFPAGLRPALPIDIADKVPNPDPPVTDTGGEADTDGTEVYVNDIIQNAATSVALIPLPEDQQGGATVVGSVVGDGTAGTLVVAEGTGTRAPYAIADSSGTYTLFNVQPGMVTVRGYRFGIEVEPATVMPTDGGLVEAVDLPVISTSVDDLAVVDGSLNIVDAPGGSVTSVVLVPSSVFNEALERGPVPVGLREPSPPEVPNVTGPYILEGVPAGTYKVLVAFENDDLVRDPDEGIAGTDIQEITISAGMNLTVDTSFKVTEALAVTGPGADTPEQVGALPDLVWADDSSEDGYELKVFNALGDIVWETEVEGVTGSATVTLGYGGPALEPGMYYQFRATSFRQQNENTDRTYISRTEDLRGVFFAGDAPPPQECTVAGDTDGTTGE